MEKLEDRKYHREITHKRYDYWFVIGAEGHKHWLPKEIYDNMSSYSTGRIKYVSDNYIEFKTDAKVGPVILLTMSLGLILFYLYIYSWNAVDTVLFWSSVTLAIPSLIYLFTMPKKKFVLNRKKGTVTFPGFLWLKNSTMYLDDSQFYYVRAKTTGLSILRTTKVGIYNVLSLVKGEPLEDLSFIVRYLDRNRPLPPGEIFDEFRKKDFERRKKEGFPRPLHLSRVPTPETTPEQQKERFRIGGW